MGHNVFEMLGVERRELSYSNFLAWLMDTDVNGEINTEFLKQFLDLVNSEYALSTNSLKIDREEEKDKSKADIVVESDKFWLIIENKVKSGEGEKQTDRLYKDWKGSDKEEIFVYLTPEYRENCERDDEFEHITYTQIRDILEDMDRTALDERTEIMIEDFIETLEVNNLVEFDGFSKESKHYIKEVKELEEKENKWKEEAEQFFNEIKKKLKKKLDKSEWKFITNKTNVEISKKSWENISYKCALNDSHIKKGIFRIGIYVDNDMENREENWKTFKEEYDGDWDTFSKAAWIKKGKEEYFEELLCERRDISDDIVGKLRNLIEETEDAIEYALKE